MAYAYTDAAPDSPRYVTATPIDHSVIDMDEAWGKREVASRQLEAPSLGWLLDCFSRDPGGM